MTGADAGDPRHGPHAAYPESYYAATAGRPVALPAASGQLHCELCVIGGGYTGLSTALHAAAMGRDVVLLEAERVGWGASGRNGGQVGSGQRRDQLALERMLGAEHARALWALGEAAKALVKALIREHAIDCELRPGILYADHKPRFVPLSRAYVAHLRDAYDYPHARFVDGEEVRAMVGSPGYHGGMLDTDAAHLHPLKYALGLAAAAHAAGARLFEGSRVLEIDMGARPQVRLAGAQVSAERLVLACNGYLGGLSPTVADHVMPINNFIVATEPLDDGLARALIRDDVAVADSRFVVNYFRLSRDRRLLFGGGESYGPRFPADIRALVRRPLLRVFPQLADVALEHAWGGTLAITMNRMPFVSRLTTEVLCVSGYSGHGVAMATLAGQLLAEAACGRPERFDVLADVPAPRFPGGAVLRRPLLVLGMLYYALRDRL